MAYLVKTTTILFRMCVKSGLKSLLIILGIEIHPCRFSALRSVVFANTIVDAHQFDSESELLWGHIAYIKVIGLLLCLSYKDMFICRSFSYD